MAFSHPEWSYNSNIYEVNTRQYTNEGTFAAFSTHLPRLKEMGVEILWFMPITPISIRDRKGTLGSYYAVKDYKSVNPEFGSLDDFRQLVSTAHQFGFKVIIDWVANHTGNDHNWLEEHSEYYQRDENNEIVHPNDWSDVSHLSFDSAGTRAAMIDAMKFWITECDIDGFRCDMAHLVPLDFWFRARTELQQIKCDLFWLAECEEPTYHNAFDATYTWEWMHTTEQLYQKKISFETAIEVLQKNTTRFHPDAFRVYFTSNHDENSWNGTEYEKYREMALPLAVFSCTWNGLPMLYSGQEIPNFKRLKFFEKDCIEWEQEPKLMEFYRALLTLKKRNPALDAGIRSSTEWIITPSDGVKCLAYKRKNQESEVTVLLNLSSTSAQINCVATGNYLDIFTKKHLVFDQESVINIDAWGYHVFEKLL